MSKKTIGTNAFSYPELRNFAGHTINGYTFKKVFDFYKILSFFLFRLKNKINRKWQNTFLDFGLNGCSFFHFFNVLNKGSKPYITTFETSLPRWHDTEKDFKTGLQLLAKKPCRQLIALSECAYKKQEELILAHQPALFNTIMAKTVVMLPPQEPFIHDIAEKRPSGEIINFTIVGADFFRKGGLAILRAFDCLLNEQCKITLNIVSTLNYGDYASKTNKQDLLFAKGVIEKHKENIHWYKQLNNSDIKSLLLKTDIALLPSLAETFGYFTLEAQAAGCPVITTDIRAMPEVNNDKKGWLINIREPNSFDANLNKIEVLNETIENELIRIIKSIIANPAVVRQKGEQALKDIIEHHSPEAHIKKLKALYDTM